jgi:DNA-binding response OmpR family regulator
LNTKKRRNEGLFCSGFFASSFPHAYFLVMGKTRILIVDDEPSVREVAQRYLERDGYTVATATTGSEGWQMIESAGKSGKDKFDLVVLDVMLPGIDGFDILRRVRINSDLPVIMLSARTDEMDRVTGLERGADDYVPKPFSPRELVSRVKAVLRRVQPFTPSTDTELSLVGITLKPDTRQVIVDGKEKELTVKEFDLLWFLMRHPRQVFSREQLLAQVWGFADYIDLSTVTVHMHRLREKIECDASKPTRLMTVWGVGYKFAAEE